MGCSSSKDALSRVVPVSPAAAPAPAARPQGQSWRSVSALTSLGFCCARDDVEHSYVKLPSFTEEEEAAKGSSNDPAVALHGEGAAAEALFAGVEDAASKTSSWQVHAARDLDSASAAMEYYPPSHPALHYPGQDCLVPPETIVAAVGMGLPPAIRDIPEVVTGTVRARVDEFHEQMEKKDKAEDDDDMWTPRYPPAALDVNPFPATPRSRPARAGKAVVLYFTSLRGVRQTFEDGRAVRAILRCYRVRLDERDVSMHAAFKSELRDLLRGSEGPALPRVFVDGRRDLGGVADMRALHEAGELARALAGCEALPAGRTTACAACGDVRFALCDTCNGSCKVFVDDKGRRLADCFQRCPDCNENGLIRCPVCCY